MGKKARRSKKASELHRLHTSNIRPMYKDGSLHRSERMPRVGIWDPLADERDERERKYTRKIKPQNNNQKRLMEAIEEKNMILAVGPAGTGKTYIAVAKAVEALDSGRVSRIILSRPAVEAGENLGFLPGQLDEKLAPFLRPLYDCLSDRIGLRMLKKYLHDGTIEIAPVAYMRGRTLNNAYVVIDEAQNCTYGQIKMLLTRLGWQSTMVLTGDPDQTDLLDNLSGFSDITDKLETLEDVSVVRLLDKDIVRHPLVAAMLSVI